jgi:anaerobic dimethyl sulfoxide reductase subunit A
MDGPDGFDRGALDMGANPARSYVPYQKWADAVLRGVAGGYPSDIKMVYVCGCNHVNQFADSNKAARALRQAEFVVVQDQFLTATARYADVVLAVDTHFEREDIQLPHGTGHYYLFSHKAIDRMYDCKSDLEIFSALAGRLGIERFMERSDEEYLRAFTARADVPDYDALKTQGVHKYAPAEYYVPLADFVADPDKHPLSTPSGKIELYSQEIERQEIARRGYSTKDLPLVPKYVEHWEGPSHPLATDFPLLLVSAHSKTLCNSTFDNVPLVRELEPHCVWLNSRDARARGIADGDQVKVFNEVGTVVLPARITERIMPGVVNIFQGAWYRPDERGWDLGGCVNTLTKDTISPALTASTNGVLVQVERISPCR